MLINVDIDFKDNFSAYILRWIPPSGKIADWLQISTDYYTKTLEFRTSLLYSKFLSSKTFNCSKLDIGIQSADNKTVNTCNGKFSLTIICINWVPGDPRTIFLVTSFT